VEPLQMRALATPQQLVRLKEAAYNAISTPDEIIVRERIGELIEWTFSTNLTKLGAYIDAVLVIALCMGRLRSILDVGSFTLTTPQRFYISMGRQNASLWTFVQS
jgi:hypothetical protein